MKVAITYEIDNKIIRQGLTMDPKSFASLRDPYSQVGRTLAELIMETAPAVSDAIDEMIFKDSMARIAKVLGLDNPSEV